MRFNGMPEIINGRLAMLGFVSAAGSEIASGKSVLEQCTLEPVGILSTSCVVILASLIPVLKGGTLEDGEQVGVFNKNAELLNGRVAMIAFALMLEIESILNQSLFHPIV